MVSVEWSSVESHAARVIELQTEMQGMRAILYKVRVEYADGQRLWHELHKMRIVPLENQDDERAVYCDDDVDAAMCEAWQKLPLRCCYSHARLTDPARGSTCLHPPMCNFEALQICLAHSKDKACPVSGCMQQLRRRDAVVRDDALRAALALLPASAEILLASRHRSEAGRAGVDVGY